jgi:SAM-dependent methyltransferase
MTLKLIHFILFGSLFCLSANVAAGQSSSDSPYTFEKGDPYGIGKWYMGREIAHVMGHRGMDWLERPERQREERVDKLMNNLNLQDGHTVVDVGAGSGYHSFRMASEIGEGKVFAVDIQEEMLSEIRRRARASGTNNVIPVKGTASGFELPSNARLADRVLMVDVYHEFSHPVEMMRAVSDAMRPDGLLYLIEYRMESKWVPIKKLHKMSEVQAVRELEAAGFEKVKNIGNLPWQHCLIFKKRP